MTAFRPLEYVCFSPIGFPVKDGNVYVFTFMDSYSKFIWRTGFESSINNDLILKHVGLLMEDEKFKMHRDKGFTLVFPTGSELQFDIETIIEPYNGKMIIDESLATDATNYVMEQLLKSFDENS